MSSFDRLSHFQSIFDNFLHRLYFLKIPIYMDILGPDRGKMTIYGSHFQQVNLTPYGGVSPTDYSADYISGTLGSLIRITCPCNVYPLTPHFYIVKLGFTGLYIIFLFLL